VFVIVFQGNIQGKGVFSMLHIRGSRMAACIAFSGLIPFIVMALCLWLVAPPWQAAFAEVLKAYASTVLAFLGGMHWGGALEDAQDRPETAWRYIYAIWPKLLAVIAVFCPAADAYFVLFLGFLASFFVDRTVYASLDWFVKLRAVLTGTVCVCLYAAYKALEH
jgi:hypothetical protein